MCVYKTKFSCIVHWINDFKAVSLVTVTFNQPRWIGYFFQPFNWKCQDHKIVVTLFLLQKKEKEKKSGYDTKTCSRLILLTRMFRYLWLKRKWLFSAHEQNHELFSLQKKKQMKCIKYLLHYSSWENFQTKGKANKVYNDLKNLLSMYIFTFISDNKNL